MSDGRVGGAPLKGLRVVELARILAGPWIGQTLADRYRDDLEQAGLGSGRHSFDFRMPRGLIIAEGNVVVRRSLDGTPLEVAPWATSWTKAIAS